MFCMVRNDLGTFVENNQKKVSSLNQKQVSGQIKSSFFPVRRNNNLNITPYGPLKMNDRHFVEPYESIDVFEFFERIYKGVLKIPSVLKKAVDYFDSHLRPPLG